MDLSNIPHNDLMAWTFWITISILLIVAAPHIYRGFDLLTSIKPKKKPQEPDAKSPAQAQYEGHQVCPECKQEYTHLPLCSMNKTTSNHKNPWVNRKPCKECGSHGKHKPGCSRYHWKIKEKPNLESTPQT